MTVFYILLAIALICAACFVIFQYQKRPFMSFALKGLATVAVLALAVYGLMFGGLILSATGILFVVGLAFCLFGDLSLAMLEFRIEGGKSRIIKTGMFAFSLAQISFAVAIFLLIGANVLAIVLPVVFGVLFSIAVFFMQKPLGLRYGDCTTMTLLYSFLLSTALGASFALAVIQGFTLFSTLLFVGLLLFIISDLILSKIYFAEKMNQVLYYPNLATYYLAIITIAGSLVYFTV